MWSALLPSKKTACRQPRPSNKSANINKRSYFLAFNSDFRKLCYEKILSNSITNSNPRGTSEAFARLLIYRPRASSKRLCLGRGE